MQLIERATDRSEDLELDDWRGVKPARVRSLIKQAHPDIENQ
ncbi:hypothetical protein [Bradyrhizobium sp. SRS-191]|nr:hypothetical protein [Bradyrhizobium sp. SRS-191]